MNRKLCLAFVFFISCVSFAHSQSFPLADSVKRYFSKENYSKAIEFADKWKMQIQAAKKATGREFDLAQLYQGLAYSHGKGPEADSLLSGLIPRLAKYRDADSLTGLAYLYLGDFRVHAFLPEGEEYLLKGIALLTKINGETDPDVAKGYLNIGWYHGYVDSPSKAEHAYRKALSIAVKLYGDHSINASYYYRQLGVCFDDFTFSTDSAEYYYRKSLAICAENFPENSSQMAEALNRMAIVYGKKGNYSKADSIHQKIQTIYITLFGEQSKQVAKSLYAKGFFYQEQMGELARAEQAYQRCIEIYENLPKADRDLFDYALNNLTNVYLNIGDLKKADATIQKRLRFQLSKKPHPADGRTYGQLAQLFFRQGFFEKAIENFRKQHKIYAQYYGKTHYVGIRPLNDVAKCFAAKGNFNQADSILNYILYCHKNADKSDTPDAEEWEVYFNARRDLAEKSGKYDEAMALAVSQYEEKRKAFGEDHMELAPMLGNLAAYARALGKKAEANLYYKKSMELVLRKVESHFPYLSENQKALFLETISADLASYISFCIEENRLFPMLNENLYDLQLQTKALLLNSSVKWKKRIKASHDKKLLTQYIQWEEFQNQLIVLENSTDTATRVRLETIRQKAEKLEKELSLRSVHFASMADKKKLSWKDIQRKLKPGEAAIEIIRLQKYGWSQPIIDSGDGLKKKYQTKGLTDTIQYAALIVKPGQTLPDLVLMKDGNLMESKGKEFYRNCIRNMVEDKQSYQLYWKKINQKLGPLTKTVFLSPEGVYHSLNIQSFYNPETQKYLLEEKDIRIVTTTKDLAISSPDEELNHLAYLIGFPDYDKFRDTRDIHPDTAQRLQNETTQSQPLKSHPHFESLPGTQKEVEIIANMLRSKGWEVQSLTGGLAMEESVKESYKPRVLHIATHGYFQPDSVFGLNPLNRSGLILAGANKSQATRDNGLEDGILTAYEAMNLNLDNTDLVVLSACETGLGEIKNGEGVYGLQRAFKVAGAKSIIMSLWKVDDEATQELMVSFYRNWLQLPESSKLSGSSKRQAFLKAQKELKAKYPNPYYWGAFVMVGE